MTKEYVEKQIEKLDKKHLYLSNTISFKSRKGCHVKLRQEIDDIHGHYMFLKSYLDSEYGSNNTQPIPLTE